MPSAVDFLPQSISVFVNFVTSLSLNLGSGMIRRLGTSRRRGMVLGLGALDAVLGALAVAVDLVGRRGTDGARGVEGAAHDVVAYAGQVLDTASTDEHDGVLLEVVALAGDVRGDLHAIREANAAHLAKRGVRLLRRRRVHANADAALLRAGLERRRRGLHPRRFAAVPNELIDRGHRVSREVEG